MPLELCKSCGRMHYTTDPCKPAQAANQLERVPQEQVEASHKVNTAPRSNTFIEFEAPEGAVVKAEWNGPTVFVEPVIPKPNRNAYMRTYMANRRAKAKANSTNPVVLTGPLN